MMLSIIIVNYNTKLLTIQTIESIFSRTYVKFEIIVVDNSTLVSESLIDFKQENVRIIQVENHGFGHACNRGSEIAIGDFVLFLNSDTIAKHDSIEKSVNYLMNHPETGALGCKILLPDGSLDHGCRRGFPTPFNSLAYFLGLDRIFPNSKVFGGYRLNYLDINQIQTVDAVSGAFLLMRRDLYVKLNGFDETFFMYGEDLDLCYRIKEQGYIVIYFPETSITHLKGQSGLRTASKTVIYHFYDAMLIFYMKHYRKKYGEMLYLLVLFAVKLKYQLTLMRGHHD